MLNATASQGGASNLYLRPHWWVYLLNGILSVVFGIFAYLYPAGTLVSLALLYGAFMLVTGVTTLIGAFQARGTVKQWGLLAVAGVFAILMGLLALILPGITLLTLVYVVAAWALVTGALEIYSFFRMSDHAHHWWMIVAGLASILFAILTLVYPTITLQVFITFVAVYAVFSGIMRIIFAFQVRSTNP